MRGRIRVVTANVQNYPDHPARVIRRYLRRLAVWAVRPDFICLQEITDRSDKIAVRATWKHYAWFHMGTEAPIGVHRRWVVTSHGRDKRIDGKAGRNTNLYITWVDVERRKDTRARRLFGRQRGRVANGHNMSGAFKVKFRDRAQRLAEWHNFHAGWSPIARHALTRGRWFIFGADHNRVDTPRIHGRQTWVAQHGIDKVGVIPAPGHTVVVSRPRIMRRHRPVDHAPVMGRIRFKVGRR